MGFFNDNNSLRIAKLVDSLFPCFAEVLAEFWIECMERSQAKEKKRYTAFTREVKKSTLC